MFLPYLLAQVVRRLTTKDITRSVTLMTRQVIQSKRVGSKNILHSKNKKFNENTQSFIYTAKEAVKQNLYIRSKNSQNNLDTLTPLIPQKLQSKNSIKRAFSTSEKQICTTFSLYRGSKIYYKQHSPFQLFRKKNHREQGKFSKSTNLADQI